MKTSDLFIKCLENEGIEYIFGVPGEENADFLMSLHKSKKINFILTRHEQGAAFMAESYGKLTGKLSCCLSTLGPGATNLLTGVADANMDHSPILVITGQGSSDRLHKESHQIMDVCNMFKSVTKWTTSVRNPSTIPEMIRKAVRLATLEKPGAVHIELPEDIAKLEIDAKPLESFPYRRSIAEDTIVYKAYELIKKSKSPILIAGNGAIRKRASRQLREFCERTGIPVVTTFMGKGAVDCDSEYFLSTVGLGAIDFGDIAIKNSDLVITLGYDMVEYHPKLWRSSIDHMLNLDGDLHINLRKEHMPFFKPGYVEELHKKVSSKISELLDNIAPMGKCNLVHEFSQQLPIYTLSEILGIPESDRQKLVTWMEFLELAQHLQAESYKKELEGESMDSPDQNMIDMFNAMVDEMFEYGRDILNKKGNNETVFLNHLQKVIDNKITNADHMISKFSKNENLDELYDK